MTPREGATLPGLGLRMELVVFVGLQASGKSTFYRSTFASTHALVSKDLFRNASDRERRQRDLVEQAFARGDSVVVDNTNPSAAERATLIELARRYGASVIGYYFQSKIAECRERNATRTGKALVSEVGLRATAARLELPRVDEGFDRLWYVAIATQGGFTVAPWQEEIDEL